MAKPKEFRWGNYPIVDPKHIPDLEYAAAIHEFGDGMAREDAEKAAHGAYAREHHQTAAAHHLRGMRAARAAGDLPEAHKHGILFGLHMGMLGHDPLDQVPDAILKLVDAEDKPATYKFKAHKADRMFTELARGGQADGKPDAEFDPKALEAGTKEEHSEHGGPKELATEIAKDHLVKEPDYYKDE